MLFCNVELNIYVPDGLGGKSQSVLLINKKYDTFIKQVNLDC